MLVSVGLRIAAVAVSIIVLTYSGDMIVLCCVRMYKKMCLVIQIRITFAVAPKPSGVRPLRWHL